MGFWDRMEEVINKGFATTKEILEKAKEKTKEVGEKGALKFQIMQLEHQTEKRLAQLGSKVYEILIKKGQKTVSKENPDIKPIIAQIQELEERINSTEKKLSSI